MPRFETKPIQLSPDSQRFLAGGLEAIAKASIHAHRRRVDRLAVTFRPCRRGSDRLPEEAVVFDDFRLLALSHRWVDRGGRVVPDVVLGIYRPVIDLPGTGRIRFACEAVLPVGGRGGAASPDPATNPTAARAALLMAREVEDADGGDLESGLILPRFFFGFEPTRPPAFKPTASREEWAAAEVAIGDYRAWPVELFARRVGESWDAHPADGSPDPWAIGEANPGVTEHGGWIRRDGRAIPKAQEPAAVLVTMDHLQGRRARNPAWDVLRDHGVIPPGTGYRRWLEEICPKTAAGRVAPNPADPASAAGRFRRALADHVDAQSARPPRILSDLAAACAAAGVPVPRDDDEAGDFLAELLENPWARAGVPDAAAIQVIRLAGPPDPGTMTFAAGAIEANLYDLGRQAARHEQLPARRVREMFRQRRMGSRMGSTR